MMKKKRRLPVDTQLNSPGETGDILTPSEEALLHDLSGTSHGDATLPPLILPGIPAAGDADAGDGQPEEDALLRALLQSAYPSPPADLHANIMAKITAAARRRRMRRHFLQWGGAAACFVMICSLAVLASPVLRKEATATLTDEAAVPAEAYSIEETMQATEVLFDTFLQPATDNGTIPETSSAEAAEAEEDTVEEAIPQDRKYTPPLTLMNNTANSDASADRTAANTEDRQSTADRAEPAGDTPSAPETAESTPHNKLSTPGAEVITDGAETTSGAITPDALTIYRGSTDSTANISGTGGTDTTDTTGGTKDSAGSFGNTAGTDLTDAAENTESTNTCTDHSSTETTESADNADLYGTDTVNRLPETAADNNALTAADGTITDDSAAVQKNAVMANNAADPVLVAQTQMKRTLISLLPPEQYAKWMSEKGYQTASDFTLAELIREMHISRASFHAAAQALGVETLLDEALYYPDPAADTAHMDSIAVR